MRLKRINVKVIKETHLLLCALSDSRHKPFDRIIFDALKKDTKKTEIIKNLELEIERLKEELPIDATETEWLDIKCLACLKHPDGYYVCADQKHPKVVKIPFLEVCLFCWEKQQKMKTQRVPESSIPKMYKKPEKIYCLGLTRWVDPDKVQAMCYRCKTQTLQQYAECQQKRAII